MKGDEIIDCLDGQLLSGQPNSKAERICVPSRLIA